MKKVKKVNIYWLVYDTVENKGVKKVILKEKCVFVYRIYTEEVAAEIPTKCQSLVDFSPDLTDAGSIPTTADVMCFRSRAAEAAVVASCR